MRLWLNRRIVYTDLGVLLSDLTTTVFDVLRIYRPILPILRLYFQMFQKSLSDSPILPILRFYLKTLKTFKMNLTTIVFDVLRIYRPIVPILRSYFQMFQKSFSDSPILPILRFYLKTLKTFKMNLTTIVFDVLRIYRPILPILRLYFQIFQKSLSDSSILPILRFYLKTLKMISP